jgi:hypothetical protein
MFWVLLTNFISMSGLDPLYYNDGFRLLYRHKLWWWHTSLWYLASAHLVTALIGIFLDNPNFKKSDSNFAYLKVLNRLLALLSIAGLVIW